MSQSVPKIDERITEQATLWIGSKEIESFRAYAIVGIRRTHRDNAENFSLLVRLNGHLSLRSRRAWWAYAALSFCWAWHALGAAERLNSVHDLGAN